MRPKKSVSTSHRQIKFLRWSCLVKFLNIAAHGMTSAPWLSEGAPSISAANSHSDSFPLPSSEVLFSATGSQLSKNEKQVEMGSWRKTRCWTKANTRTRLSLGNALKSKGVPRETGNKGSMGVSSLTVGDSGSGS